MGSKLLLRLLLEVEATSHLVTAHSAHASSHSTHGTHAAHLASTCHDWGSEGLWNEATLLGLIFRPALLRGHDIEIERVRWVRG